MELSFILLTDTATATLYNKVLPRMKVCAKSEAVRYRLQSLCQQDRYHDAHVINLSLDGGKILEGKKACRTRQNLGTCGRQWNSLQRKAPIPFSVSVIQLDST